MVQWVEPVAINNDKFDKSLSATEVDGLWYVGVGILIEEKGYDDLLIPISAVRRTKAEGKFSSELWTSPGGSERRETVPLPVARDVPNYVLVAEARNDSALEKAVIAQTTRAAEELKPSSPKKGKKASGKPKARKPKHEWGAGPKT